ncbi:unnamed protein product [Gongylonema pulchrum]|uniref:ABC transporter permease n=1 Tax=Gongylonema pulchrum TaxID=637853 RepID=A0A183EIC5_9BILA|nr:unnamed protein product [Gongylonema pulchrum]
MLLAIGVFVTTHIGIHGNMESAKRNALLARDGRAPLLSRYGKRTFQAPIEDLTGFGNIEEVATPEGSLFIAI